MIFLDVPLFLMAALYTCIAVSYMKKYTIYPLSCFSDPYCMLGIRPGPPPAKPQVYVLYTLFSLNYNKTGHNKLDMILNSLDNGCWAHEKFLSLTDVCWQCCRRPFHQVREGNREHCKKRLAVFYSKGPAPMGGWGRVKRLARWRRELKPNSWTYNFFEVSGHNLESFFMDFLNPRDGGLVFIRFSSFLLYSVHSNAL